MIWKKRLAEYKRAIYMAQDRSERGEEKELATVIGMYLAAT